MPGALLDLMAEAVALLRALVDQERPRLPGCGRPLGPDSLLTASETARELRMRDADARRLCRELRPVRDDGVKLYRWGDVLDLMHATAGAANTSPAPAAATGSALPRASVGGW